MMKLPLRFSSLVLGLMLYSLTAWAQPANDDCIDAVEITYSNTEAGVVKVTGDTRGASASTQPTSVCSTVNYTDDIWFKFTTPAVLPANGLIIRTWFNPATNPSDIPAVGMGLYESCGLNETPLRCFSANEPTQDRLEVSGCLLPSHEYVVRVWSTGGTTATEGTFQIGVYANLSGEVALWLETFGGGIEANGWTTEGTCADPDSNANAGWKYLPDGLLDKGAYIFDGAGINSPTLCDGAVGVDSDFEDNNGVQGAQGTGPCTSRAQHTLTSPIINSSEWNVAGLSLTWTQAIRQFRSDYFFSYRVKDGDEEFGEWVDFVINTEFAVNGDFLSDNVQRHFMPGAAGHDAIQLRFVYNAEYYMWGIDDVKIVETECSNTRAQSNFFAIAPWAIIPSNQVYPFAGLNDVYNAGACAQTNVKLNYTVVDTSTDAVIYDKTVLFGTIDADSLAENKPFPDLVVVPEKTAGYEGTYTVSQDLADFDSTDNVIKYNFRVGGHVFALEDGSTRSVAVAETQYDDGAPLSYAYGNYFIPQEDAVVADIVWGVNNTADMIDKTVSIYLLQWTDTNGDQIAENGERKFVGYAEYTFDGSEGIDAVFTTVLDNFENPGDDVVMRGGFGYMAIVEYVASDATDPQFFMLASEDRNYDAQVLAMDSLFDVGIADMRVYASVLGHSPDGIIANIDYEVTELDAADNRIFFGNSIVPLVRIEVDPSNTVDPLPLDNLITVYPNPASDNLQVKLEFTKPNDNVKVRLIDNLGRTAFQKLLTQQITDHIESIRVSDLAPGNYMLQIETKDGQRSVPVVIVK